jgi:hypothetical protein
MTRIEINKRYKFEIDSYSIYAHLKSKYNNETVFIEVKVDDVLNLNLNFYKREKRKYIIGTVCDIIYHHGYKEVVIDKRTLMMYD